MKYRYKILQITSNSDFIVKKFICIRYKNLFYHAFPKKNKHLHKCF